MFVRSAVSVHLAAADAAVVRLQRRVVVATAASATPFTDSAVVVVGECEA